MTNNKEPRETYSWANPNANYEYVNKNSKRIWPSVVFGSLICLGLLAFGIWRWYEIGQAEQTGAQISMNSLEWMLYKAGGRWLNLGFFCVVCVLAMFGIIRNAQTRKRLRDH
jgi:hypothetical protein